MNMLSRSFGWRVSNLFSLSLAVLVAVPATIDAAPAGTQRRDVDAAVRVSRGEQARQRLAAEVDQAMAESVTAIEAANIAPDLPASELALDAMLPTVPPFDHEGAAFGAANGQVCILSQDDFTLVSRHSANGGTTFGGTVQVAGGASQPRVKQFAARRAANGSIYAALVVADMTGGLGLQVVRSDDMCQTWGNPVTLVQNGDASHGVAAVDLATGAAGVVAVIYRGNLGFHPYVRVSTDSGSNWTTAARLDSGVTVRSTASLGESIAIDATSGNIYAAFAQDRGLGSAIWYTRSINGGASFVTEANLNSILPAQFDSLNPQIVVASDASVSIAFWDAADDGHVYAVRSTNAGQSYALTKNIAGTDTFSPLDPVLATAAGSSTLMLAFVDELGNLKLFRSANNGATYSVSGVTLVTTASAADGIGDRTLIRIVRTAAGRWAIGWSDDRADSYAQLRNDVYVRTSTDDGVTWGLERRADSGTAGAATSRINGLATSGTDDLFVLFQDRRDDGGRSANMYANRSVASPLAFGTDYRVDTDSGTVSLDVNLDPVVATDGINRVYAAFGAFRTGPESDIFVARSSDGGYTFGVPVRVGNTTAGSSIDILPMLRATADGHVYLVYLSDAGGGTRQLRFNRSRDFGSTWKASDTILGTLGQPAGYFGFLDRPAVQIAALPGGTVYVAWSDGANVFLARSFDGGDSFATADIDQDDRGFNRAPRLCAQGSQVVVVWQGADLAFANTSVWGVTSSNSGSSWASAVQLRPDVGAPVDLHTLACDGVGAAVAIWPDERSGTDVQLWANRFNGTSWSGNFQVPAPAGTGIFFPVATYTSGTTHVVVAYEVSGGQIYTSRSTDGGISFLGSFLRLDDGLTEPVALSLYPRVASDKAGNVWVSWLDESAGLPALVTRHSGNSGSSFNAARRVDRADPSGGSQSFYFPVDSATPATLPGAAFFVWAAERQSFLPDTLINAYDLDDQDRDRFPASAECDDQNPLQPGFPYEVVGMTLRKITGGVRLTWPQAAGATSDVVGGLLSNLKASGGYGAASCLSNDQAAATYDDLTANPPSGEARYYLVRQENACATGTFGNSSLLADPRDALDAGGACANMP